MHVQRNQAPQTEIFHAGMNLLIGHRANRLFDQSALQLLMRINNWPGEKSLCAKTFLLNPRFPGPKDQPCTGGQLRLRFLTRVELLAKPRCCPPRSGPVATILHTWARFPDDRKTAAEFSWRQDIWCDPYGIFVRANKWKMPELGPMTRNRSEST